MNYPTATNKAIENLIGIRIDKPNDLLALAYIREVFVQKMKVSIRNIPRTNDYHSTKVKGKIASATAIRKSFLENASINKLIPYKEEYLYKLSMNNYFPYLKYKILLEGNSIKRYQSVDEGIENRILKYLEVAQDYNDLIMKIKTKDILIIKYHEYYCIF